MYQTLCADMHFITGAACTVFACAVFACAGQLLGEVKHAGRLDCAHQYQLIKTNGLAYHKCCSIRSATLREKDSAPYPGQLQSTQRNLGGRDSRVECVCIIIIIMSLQLVKGGKEACHSSL